MVQKPEINSNSLSEAGNNSNLGLENTSLPRNNQNDRTSDVVNDLQQNTDNVMNSNSMDWKKDIKKDLIDANEITNDNVTLMSDFA
ncbi:hypothetical protein ABK040_005490 [Willaertia magna]